MALRDQRSMMGARQLRSVSEVRAVWEHWGKVEGFDRGGKRVKPAELVDTGMTLDAFVSSGRWVADCPVCGGGVAGWPEHDQGACLGCGSLFAVAYPDATQIEQAERALASRSEQNRHWLPLTETAGDLMVENEAHGLPTDGSAVPAPTLQASLERSFGGDEERAARAVALLAENGLL